MPKLSAGLLLYRRAGDGVEVLVAHPGGPIWSRRDTGAWSLPKGAPLDGEELLETARREFERGDRPRAARRPDRSTSARSGCGRARSSTPGRSRATSIRPRLRSMIAEIEWPPAIRPPAPGPGDRPRGLGGSRGGAPPAQPRPGRLRRPPAAGPRARALGVTYRRAGRSPQPATGTEARHMLGEFKAFLTKSNALALAIGVIIGAASARSSTRSSTTSSCRRSATPSAGSTSTSSRTCSSRRSTATRRPRSRSAGARSSRPDHVRDHRVRGVLDREAADPRARSETRSPPTRSSSSPRSGTSSARRSARSQAESRPASAAVRLSVPPMAPDGHPSSRGFPVLPPRLYRARGSYAVPSPLVTGLLTYFGNDAPPPSAKATAAEIRLRAKAMASEAPNFSPRIVIPPRVECGSEGRPGGRACPRRSDNARLAFVERSSISQQPHRPRRAGDRPRPARSGGRPSATSCAAADRARADPGRVRDAPHARVRVGRRARAGRPVDPGARGDARAGRHADVEILRGDRGATGRPGLDRRV